MCMPTTTTDSFIQPPIQTDQPEFDTLPLHSQDAHIELNSFSDPSYSPDHTSILSTSSSSRSSEEGSSKSGSRKNTSRPSPIKIPQAAPRHSPTSSDAASPSSSGPETSQMSWRTRSSPKPKADGQSGSAAAQGKQNGHARSRSSGDSMESHVELRRKNLVLDYPTSESQAAHLMGREGFSLDSEVPDTPSTPKPTNTSFFDLPRQDRRNFLLLVLLYFLQGIPMGLAGGSVPFLLKSHLSYGQIGVFSLASYPYSLKLLWSPIVDAVWNHKLGRRK